MIIGYYIEYCLVGSREGFGVFVTGRRAVVGRGLFKRGIAACFYLVGAGVAQYAARRRQALPARWTVAPSPVSPRRVTAHHTNHYDAPLLNTF